MAKLYRKSLLEKLSSPDQLDKMIAVTPPSFWIALVGGAVIIVVTLIWSFTGTIPEKVDTNGVYICDQNAYIISSEVSGIVESVDVSVGDEVKEGDILYTMDTDSLEEELGSLKKRLEAVKNITLSSRDDTANQDTQNLLTYKAQYISAGDSSASAAYDLALEKYEECKADASKAEKKAQNASEEYAKAAALVNEASDAMYNQKLNGQKTLISYLNTELLYYEEAYNYWAALETGISAYTDAITAYQGSGSAEALAVINNFEQNLNTKASAIRIAYASACQACTQTGRSIVNYVPGNINYNLTEQTIAINGKNVTVSELLSEITVSSNEVKSQYDETESILNSAQNEYRNIQLAMSQDPACSSNSTLASLKNAYETALNEYQSKAQLEASAQQTLFSYEANKVSSESSTKSQSEAYRTQFIAAKGALVDQFEQEIEKYEKQIEMSSVTSTMDGIITNLAISKGAAVSQGNSTVVIRQKDDTEEVVLYVSITDGKIIEEGMKVNVYPTTLNRSEYGHMSAVVKHVAEYITTDQEIFNKIGDQGLAQLFTQNGSVVEVECELVKDETSANGYAWSTNKGKTVSLKESTIVSAEIITDEQHPISILLPFLKDKLENLTKEEK